MHKSQKKRHKLIKTIINYINSDIKLKSSFNHPNRKYKITTLLKYVIQILSTGLSFRQFGGIINKNISWCTIYKFFIKLQKTNVISLSYYDTVKKYIQKNLNNNNNTNIFITDTTIIPNKLGIDKIGYNPQIPKHKASKISLITDEKGMPLEANIYSCSCYDSKILNMQLDDFNKNNKLILNNNNILLGDAGYDSNQIRDKLIAINFGKLVAVRNKRNIKNKAKLEAIKLLPEEKQLLKKRIKIEHTNAHLKQYKLISLRYDKFSFNYCTFLHLACLNIILKKS